MAFPKVAAFGTGMVVFVRVVACRLPVSKSMYHDSFTTFWGCYYSYSFCRKEKQNPPSDNGLYHYW